MAMTTKDRTVAALRQAAGGRILMNCTEIARALGIGKNGVNRFMEGARCFRDGKSKRYLVDEVAEKLLERMG